MAYRDLIVASIAVVAAVPGVVTAYDDPPEVGPSDALLPAVVARPAPGTIAYTASQEIWTHGWYIDLLVARGDNLAAQYQVLHPFLSPLVAAFRERSTLGLGKTVYDVRATAYEMSPIAYLDATYLGITITMTGKEKIPVTLG